MIPQRVKAGEGGRSQMTEDDPRTGEGQGEDSACRVLRILPECEKVLRGQLAEGRGSHLLNLLQAPLSSLSVLGTNS